METISAFAKRTGAELTVMPGGEHWFHTEEQMKFLDAWITGSGNEAGVEFIREYVEPAFN